MVVEINIKYLIVYVYVTSRNTSLETPLSLGLSVWKPRLSDVGRCGDVLHGSGADDAQINIGKLDYMWRERRRRNEEQGVNP